MQHCVPGGICHRLPLRGWPDFGAALRQQGTQPVLQRVPLLWVEKTSILSASPTGQYCTAEADEPTSTEEVDDNALATGSEDKNGAKTAGNQNDLNIEKIKENNDETTFRPKRMVFSKTQSSAGQENS